MRILMLSPHRGVRGPLPKHTPILVDALRDRGCRVVSEPWGRRGDDETALQKLPRLVKDVLRVRRLLTKQTFDVLVLKTSHEWKSILRDVPLLLAVRRRVPSLVVQFHGGHSDILVRPGHRAFKLASRLLFSACDGVLVLSTQEARESGRFHLKAPFRTVANPYVPKNPRGESPKDGGGTLLFASRLIVEKGILDLLTALSLLRARVDCRLVVAGSGPAEAQARERARGLSLDDKVTFVGHLSEAQMTSMYRSSDVFVLPTYWAEGFPTAITEAMDAGLPIVTTRIRGTADHLEEGVNALFVPARDPERLATALERVLRDADLRAEMRQANRQKVQEFDPPRVARNYLHALEDIVSSTVARS